MEQLEQQIQLNYVIPENLSVLLANYCGQNMVKPSLLIRRLVCDYVNGDRQISKVEHPKGRRTTVALPSRLLDAFESKVEALGHRTKAAVIAALLGDFLPNRVMSGETVQVVVEMPSELFNRVSRAFGPGPNDIVVLRAVSRAVSELSMKESGKCQV